MGRFIFSADAHVMEPGDLFSANLPDKFKANAIVADRTETHMITRAGEQIIHRLPITPQTEEFGGRKRLGIRDLGGRLADMELDGIDAELWFPSLGLWTFTLADPGLEQATARVYNEWVLDFAKDHRDRFVPNAILPVRDFRNTLEEIERVATAGFTSAMLPVITPGTIPSYNSAEWDPIFAAGGGAGLAFCLHTGTGLEDVVTERGPGAAVINYTRQMQDAQNSITYLVAGGVLDRNPKAAVAYVEAGASWLGAVAERMDEVYKAHDIFVRPKLSRMPSEIVRDQVKATFQSDRECVIGRQVTGHQAIMWGADYPHAEGTFPNSQTVIDHIFDGVDITEDEICDIVGRTGAKFFGLKHPDFMAA